MVPNEGFFSNDGDNDDDEDDFDDNDNNDIKDDHKNRPPDFELSPIYGIFV